MTPAQRQQKIHEITNRLAKRLEDQWPEGEVPLNDLEDLAQRLGQDVMLEIAEELLGEQAERQEGNQSACSCGARATYRGHYNVTIVTAVGRVRVRRAYFYCEGCRHGHCPTDEHLGLGPARTTATAQARIAVLAALVPYTQVGHMLCQLGLPLTLDIRSIERITQQVGRRVQVAPPPLAATPQARPQARPQATAKRPLAVAVDGVMLPTWQGYKEARCGVVYEPDWQAGRTPAAEAGLRKEYVATLGSRESLVQAACERVERRRASPECQGAVAALGDGADWIWENYAKYLPQRIEILDFYHVCERLAVIAASLHPAAPATAQQWRQAQEKALLEEGPSPLLRFLGQWQPATPAAQEVRRVQLGYFAKQQTRMQYPD